MFHEMVALVLLRETYAPKMSTLSGAPSIVNGRKSEARYSPIQNLYTFIFHIIYCAYVHLPPGILYCI